MYVFAVCFYAVRALKNTFDERCHCSDSIGNVI